MNVPRSRWDSQLPPMASTCLTHLIYLKRAMAEILCFELTTRPDSAVRPPDLCSKML